MSKVVLDVSVSLDRFTASPNVREAEPIGNGDGQVLPTPVPVGAAGWPTSQDN